uniref:Chaperone DnaJ C-terminal domain-containing protein n=1 Tax=Euplotes harpa TaxID=151035 RepID=A0A7S3JLY7_9SPIT|mmetsp:Transcript_8881/g.10049  ORF Transcript_8881/g.10049 Transcript_8881/m.10049 type:complete len:160 (+) Transcript_8881:327-806(+)|eukprot:CAMPEP_0168356354 /NCGR_PEP_ID=MMETSP0213-20121227/25099_1 /TAXON_ID=151035 /ORGANISM="Euplotes harpa, Strain FSP1.4" /LENGTH=159 /DNA_ID=CAMNT_0008368745 /DNA_START=160 /DNA_END=639 /DNA_ORIENTATION=-
MASSGASGDINVYIHIVDNPKQQICESKNGKYYIQQTIKISLTEAILGTKRTIDTIYDTYEIVIPGGTNPNDSFIIEPFERPSEDSRQVNVQVDDYFASPRGMTLYEGGTQIRNFLKTKLVTVVNVEIELPTSLSDTQMKILHDYQQIESSISQNKLRQ